MWLSSHDSVTFEVAANSSCRMTIRVCSALFLRRAGHKTPFKLSATQPTSSIMSNSLKFPATDIGLHKFEPRMLQSLCSREALFGVFVEEVAQQMTHFITPCLPHGIVQINRIIDRAPCDLSLSKSRNNSSQRVSVISRRKTLQKRGCIAVEVPHIQDSPYCSHQTGAFPEAVRT